MSVYKKLADARVAFHKLQLKKTGHNKFAGYYYFELADFLIPAINVFAEHGLLAVVSFSQDIATMTIHDVDGGESITITSPMGSAALKGCHEVQNIGAVETYQRRYLWVAALEIVEHDALDSTTGSGNIVDDYQVLVEKWMSSIAAIKTALANEDYSTAKEAWNEIPDDEKTALWKAPSKGGCFTTKEREQMKSNEWREAQ